METGNKLKDILTLDARKEENKEIIQRELRRIKPLAKCAEHVPIEKLEKCLKVLCVKYKMHITTSVDSHSSDEGNIWYVCITDDKTGKILGDCSGLGIYDVLSKTVLFVYNISKSRGKKK